mmetsp:Transcript_6067/g.20093  ORF Transcript_6067/g.20093 Transcript_6067/m.20093 type:complete len:206 (-) Transcript_6067:153-770(-)
MTDARGRPPTRAVTRVGADLRSARAGRQGLQVWPCTALYKQISSRLQCPRLPRPQPATHAAAYSTPVSADLSPRQALPLLLSLGRRELPPASRAKEGDVLQFSPHAEKLTKQRHEHQAHDVDCPPLPRDRPAAVHDATKEVEQVRRRRKVEALLRALDDEAEEERTGDRVEKERKDSDPTTGVRDGDGVGREEVAQSDGGKVAAG